jgi:hypothetical protein
MVAIMNNPIAVVTTINPPTKQVRTLASKIPVIVVGDRKTPEDWALDNTTYINPDEAPFNHYARKNFGYLEAMRRGATVIYDTDDDNEPNKNWRIRDAECNIVTATHNGWLNAYAYFTKRSIWPRGMPLGHEQKWPVLSSSSIKRVPIQQGLADGSPDVDAVWRLVDGCDIRFTAPRSIHLGPGAWCPFNSQSTWWFPEAYCLMYLPEFATFRMTDIWRSFIAQRCLWEIGAGVAFHSPAEVYQERNPHDLMKDFEDEIPGYLHNEKIAEVLGGLKLTGNIGANMISCYQAMIDMGVLDSREILSLQQWLQSYEDITTNMGRP